jgi:hypothetical protein
MKKISSLIVLFVMLVVSFALLFGNQVKTYSKTNYKQAIENAIKPLDTPKPPEKTPSSPKPVPKQPSKNQQPPGGGQKGSEPSNPNPPPPGNPGGPCSCGAKPGSGSG